MSFVDIYFYWGSVHLQSEDRKSISVAADAPGDTTTDACEPIRALRPEADDSVYQSPVSTVGDQGQPSTPQLHTDRCPEPTSPPKTPSSVSLAESMQSASHSESNRHSTDLCIFIQTHIWKVFLRYLTAGVIIVRISLPVDWVH